MRVEPAKRAMDQGPLAIDPVRQKSRIFVLRLHDHAIPLEGVEIFCECQGHTRPAVCVRGIGDGILAQFRNIGDAWVFYAPQFIRKVIRVGSEGGLGVDLPVIDAIR